MLSRDTHSWGKAVVAVAPEHTVTFNLCRAVLRQHGDRTRTGGTASLKRVMVKHSKRNIAIRGWQVL